LKCPAIHLDIVEANMDIAVRLMNLLQCLLLV